MRASSSSEITCSSRSASACTSSTWTPSVFARYSSSSRWCRITSTATFSPASAEWALEGRLEVTALSAGAYPAVADSYLLLPHGASFGEGYGPIVVAREDVDLHAVEIVTPGPLTTAKRVLELALGSGVHTRDLPF